MISFGAIDCEIVTFNRFYRTNKRGGLPLFLLRKNTGCIQTVLKNIDVIMGKGSVDDYGMMLDTWGDADGKSPLGIKADVLLLLQS